MDLLISASCQRSGSTLLQRIFNKRDKTLIWGENGNLIKSFLSIRGTANYFSDSSKNERQAFKEKGANAWIANMTPEKETIQDATILSMKTFFDHLYSNKNHDFIGFKEVRLDLEELQLFMESFPKAHIILLVRHPVNVWKSLPEKWFTLQKFITVWNQRTQNYIKLNQLSDQVSLVRYEDLVAKNPETIKKISQLSQLESQDIYDVLEVKVGSTRHKKDSTHDQQILRATSHVRKLLNY